MLVLIYDDFRRDNERIVREVLRFLEVDESDQLDATRRPTQLCVRARSG